jgi:hypothetical protein
MKDGSLWISTDMAGISILDLSSITLLDPKMVRSEIYQSQRTITVYLRPMSECYFRILSIISGLDIQSWNRFYR